MVLTSCRCGSSVFTVQPEESMRHRPSDGYGRRRTTASSAVRTGGGGSARRAGRGRQWRAPQTGGRVGSALGGARCTSSHVRKKSRRASRPPGGPAYFRACVAGHLRTLAVRARSPRRDAGAVPRAGPTTGPSGRRGRLRREPRRILSPRRRADTEDHDRSPSRVVLVAAAPVDTGRSATEAGPDPSRHDHFAWSPARDIDQLGDV